MGGRICLERENFSREVNFVEMLEKFRGRDRLLAGIAGKIWGSQKKFIKKFEENEVK